MRLFDNLLGLSGVKVLLVEAEAVEGLVIGSLVPAEPLTDTILDGVGDVIDVTLSSGCSSVVNSIIEKKEKMH